MTTIPAFDASAGARLAAPRKHPVDDPSPISPDPVAPVDEPAHHEPPVEEPDDEEPADT